MRVKQTVTEVNMRTVREAPRAHSFAARTCCQKYQLELPEEEATHALRLDFKTCVTRGYATQDVFLLGP